MMPTGLVSRMRSLRLRSSRRAVSAWRRIINLARSSATFVVASIIPSSGARDSPRKNTMTATTVPLLTIGTPRAAPKPASLGDARLSKRSSSLLSSTHSGDSESQMSPTNPSPGSSVAVGDDVDGAGASEATYASGSRSISPSSLGRVHASAYCHSIADPMASRAIRRPSSNESACRMRCVVS